ncbi:MAG: TolC family protein [Chitinophagales bacterium]|nr:TolC family protein [Chitinophagales bacterium]
MENFLEDAYANNPELKALQLEYESALERGKQVNQLSDPQLGIGVPVLRPETRVGPQVLMVNASQMFPWFGTLKTKEDIALTMAKTKYERIALTRLNLNYLIETSYYELFLIQEKQEILKKHIALFKGLENSSLSKVSSGSASVADVLSLQIKGSELAQQIEILELQKQEFYALVNAKVNRSIDEKINLEGNYRSLALIEYDLTKYEEKIIEFHPLIQQLNWQIESSEKEQKLNNLSGKPTIGIGLDYALVLNRTDMIPIDNGKDILVPKIMVSLPIYRKKYKAKNQEESLIQESLHYQKEELSNQFLARLEGLKSKYDQQILNIQYKQAQLELTASAFQILLAEYSNKNLRFDELIQIQNKQLQYELDVITAVLNTYKIKAEIDRLTNY